MVDEPCRLVARGLRSAISPSGTRVETEMGAWRVRPLHGEPLWVGEASEGGTDGVQMSNLTAIQNTV